ncbi:MAG: tetratricopeptide repeat protein [Prevotella sp.]|nr:tetratricopeptide repeat protein [Prevotella sp.]
MNIISKICKVKVLVIGVSLFHLFTFSPLQAQPSWVKKATKSVFTVKTFAADGSLIGSSNGFYTGTDGEAISNFTPFKGASRAVIIDAAGKEIPVSGIMGANDMYDVVKFRVAANKTQPLTIATDVAPTGSTVWLLPYLETKTIKSGLVRKAETFQEEYAYYTVAMQTPETAVSCPLLNDAGEVIGLMQQPASATDSLSYAVSARFADSLKVTGLSLNDPTLRLTAIKKELPSTLSDANLLIYLAGSSTDSATYAGLVNDMIEKFPKAPEGYLYRAQLAADAAKYADADKDMEQALKVAQEKDDVLFNYARMIYNKDIYQNIQPYEPWTLDKALTQIQQAYGINPQPAYRQLEGNILFAQKKYDEAYNIFTELTESNLDKAEMWYGAARCKEMLKDTTAMMALLDSAVNVFSKPYLKQAAPYLWTRGNKRFDLGKYRDAVHDFNEYEKLMGTQVNARFYYIRHQAEIEGRLYQQALNDINRAIQLEPKETLYYAEKAALQVRVGQYDEAIETADECLAIEPDGSNGYLFKGLAQCLKGNKKDGLENLQKAKDMGDPQAEGLIEKYK